MQRFDIGTFLGIVAALGLVILSIQVGGGINAFVDLPSLVIVIGGTLGATLITFPLEDFVRAMPALRTAFFPNEQEGVGRIARLLDFARRFQSETKRDVEFEIGSEEDRFLKQGLELLSEGHDAASIRKILELDLSFIEDRHRRSAQLFQTMGTTSPAMGLIGTLIGLVQMLQNLNNTGSIGPAMAVALLTTFYGATLANLVFLPLAGKLRSRSEEEFALKELTIEGIAGIAEGLNPRMIERRMLSCLPPELRVSEYE